MKEPICLYCHEIVQRLIQPWDYIFPGTYFHLGCHKANVSTNNSMKETKTCHMCSSSSPLHTSFCPKRNNSMKDDTWEENKEEKPIEFPEIDELLKEAMQHAYKVGQVNGEEYCFEYSSKIKHFIRKTLSSHTKEVESRVVKICEDIFVEEIDHAEWGRTDEEARKDFREYLKDRGLSLEEDK